MELISLDGSRVSIKATIFDLLHGLKSVNNSKYVIVKPSETHVWLDRLIPFLASFTKDNIYIGGHTKSFRIGSEFQYHLGEGAVIIPLSVLTLTKSFVEMSAKSWNQICINNQLEFLLNRWDIFLGYLTNFPGIELMSDIRFNACNPRGLYYNFKCSCSGIDVKKAFSCFQFKHEPYKFKVCDTSPFPVAIKQLKVGEKPLYLFRDSYDYISQVIIETGNWEGSMINYAKSLIFSEANILDIGANLGTWSLELSKSTSGKIYAFEPQLKTFLQLAGNLWINGCFNVIPHRCALGTSDMNGTKTFIKTPDEKNNGQARIVDDKTGEEVEMRSLDSFEFPKISLIKMDVEGFESKVLQGAEKLIRRDRPYIIFESWSSDHQNLCEQIQKLGYRIAPCPGSLDNADYVAIPI